MTTPSAIEEAKNTTKEMESLEMDGNVSVIQHFQALTVDKEDDDSKGNSQSYLKPKTIPLTTKEGVAKEIKKWIEMNGHDRPKSYENAVKYIELKLARPLSCLETTWAERQYVKTVLELWLETSLGKAFEYLNMKENDISSKDLSTVLSQLDSIDSLYDIRSQLNDVESPLLSWCDGECRYLKLILDQTDLFTNTPHFTMLTICYLKQFKTSSITKVFSRCLSDIVKDKTNGEKHGKFIAALNEFLSNVNEEKNLKDILEKEEFLGNYAMNESKTGQEWVKKLVEVFNWTKEEHRIKAAAPEWLQTFLDNANSLSEDEWTPPLKALTKETCKKFLLPDKIKFKVKDGKQIISIRGVAIFVSKTIEEMNLLKSEHPDVEEIKIVGLKSVHIDCDLDNDNWHGINIGIVTDKLIVDEEVCWDVSGKNATINPPRGKYRQPGESGGNVHVVCNEIINGQKWTIVSDGSDGNPAYKWTKEEFEKSFPSMLTGEREKAMERVLTTLQEILPNEKRRIGQDILPEHTGNFLIEGIADDGSEITAIFYGEDSTKETLILIKRGHIGQGGYGGDITVECFSSKGSSTRTEIPFAGMDTRGKRLTTIRMGVYEASGSNGKTGKVTGDVAFIHKVAKGSDNACGSFYGFDKDEKILIRLDVAKATKTDKNLYVQYESKRYAKLLLSNYSPKDLQSVVILVDAVKKNAIIRQSLLQHFDQIDERKQMTKSIQKMLSNTTEDQSKSIDEIVNGMENKVHQAHQLTTQRQQHQFEKIQQEQYVKPAIDSSSSLSNPKIIGRRLVWNDFGVNCLDELPTEDDADSALHCLFGQMNSEGKYVCKDTIKFRKRIAKYIRRKHDDEKTYNAVGTFVFRVKGDEKRFPAASVKRDEYIKSIVEKYQQLKGMETQILRWLNHNEDYDKEDFLDPEEVDKWKGAWEIIGDPKIIKAELLKEQEDWRNEEDLKPEYAKYIESSTGILGLAELEILAITLLIKVNIYINYDSSSFGYKETLRTKEHQTISKMSNNPTPSRKYCILYEGNGRWKRLTPNYNLKFFCDEFTQKNVEQNCSETVFVQLQSWIKENANIDKKEDVKTSMEKLKNNAPHKLFQLLFDRINPNLNDGQINQFIDAICSLVKWVEYYNSRNVSPFFYLHIVKRYEPGEWECEFLLLEMEERLEKPWENKEERENWRKVVSEYLNNHGGALSLFIKIAMEKKRDNDILFSLDLNKLLRILTVLEKGNLKESILNEVDISQISLINFFYKQRSIFWEKKVDEWLKVDEQLKEKNKKEYVIFLLEMELKNDIELPQKLTNDTVNEVEIKLRNKILQGRDSTSTELSRNVDAVLADMRGKNPETKHTEMMEKTRKNVNDSKSNQLEFKNGVKSTVKELIKLNPKKYSRLKIFLKEEKCIDVNTTIPEHSNIEGQTLQKSAALDKKKETTISELFFEIINMAKELHQPQHVCNKIGKLFRNGVDLTDDSSLTNFLCVFDYAVKFTMGFSLRDTQRVAIMTLLVNGFIGNTVNTLAQVSTGEGKSIIVAGVAIGFALSIKRKKKGKFSYWKLQEVLFRKKEKRSNNKIDVITSNDVLAVRDSSLPVAEGGLKELYEFFNVTVANNCSQLVDDRKRAYNMDVVYGQLGNFQRDYLLDEFYNRNIRGDRSMDYGIIDEVDCMLLDRGNNMLYLSHDIPGMEMLESLYVFIWGKIRDTLPEVIKSAVLYDLYGQITEEDLNSIYAPLGQEEKSVIWKHLIEQQIIDRRGRLLIEEVSKNTEEKINYMSTKKGHEIEKHLNSKVIFYLRTVVKRERHIRIPDHLLDFVDRHLDTWLDNAKRALELNQDEDYVIDQNRSDTSPDLNPQVIIIDPDTGTDQSSSQWDGALHQFLQLKEGCKLTMQSLKAVFISNAKYMKKYNNTAGVSGTLGSEPETEFLKKKYKCDLFTIPTASPKRFRIKPSKFFKTKESWLRAITEETLKTIKNRSIVIFCRSIKEANQVHEHLKSSIPVLRNNNKRIHRYTRDYEKFEFEKEPGLDVGNVIVATNLAGRGTDIKLSETLKANGGLHICLTYFPENERVEEQAMGRASRKGEPGSGILILCELPTGQGEESGTGEEWGVEKILVMKEKRAWKERQRISRLKKDFNNIEMLDDLIDHYVDNLSVFKIKEMLEKEKFKKVKNSSENRIVQLLDDNDFLNLIHNNTLDKWALWLDERDNSLKCFDLKHKERKLKLKLHSFGNDIFQWMTPARRIVIIKHLAMTKSEQINITDTLNKLIDSTDKFFYPAAFYYRAFILLREWKHGNDEFKKEKNEFIRTLRNSETILNEHIDMQIFFSLVHQSEMKPDNSSFCTVDGYQEQKENNIKILQYFLGSIQWLLGRHCSISELQEAGNDCPKVTGLFTKNVKKCENFIDNKKIAEMEELKEHQIRLEKVDEYFRKLIKSECIVCELNHPETIPSNNIALEKLAISSDKKQSQIILQIADDYGISASLEEKLKSVFVEALNEEEIEKKLKKEIQIPCTRKAFWEELVKANALKPVKECINMNCVIMSEKQLDELDRRKAITLDFGVKSFDENNNSLYVLYNPTYDSQQELGAAKMVMFSKEYVKRILLPNEYRKRKKNFESNKIAKLDLNKLKEVKLFGQLGMEDLDRIKIDPTEQDGIWNELVNQNVINDDGCLEPGYDFTKDFNYPECPAYADAVTRLVRKKFVAEIVRQQWLKFKDNPKAINLLRRKPYRDLLADLMAAHVISGARVTENFAIDFKEEVDKITEYDQERDCLMEFLKSRLPAYAVKEITPEYFLDFMEGYIKSNNFASELYVFRLVGFDHVIDIRDREWTFKRICLASLSAPFIIAVGLASIGGGATALFYTSIIKELFGFKLPFGICKNVLFIGGFSDILYVVETILSRKNFTWSDYGRQRIRSTIGKMKPIDAIKAIWKLRGSSNQSFKDATITNEHRWNKQEDRNQVKTK